MAETITTAAVTVETAAGTLILQLKNFIESLTDDQKGECKKLQTEVEVMTTFYEMANNESICNLPGKKL